MITIWLRIIGVSTALLVAFLVLLGVLFCIGYTISGILAS